MILFKIALRNVFRHRTRSLITVSAIAFGAVALIFVGGFFEDILYKLRESYIKAHTGHLQIYSEGFYEQGSAAPFDYLIEDPALIHSYVSVIDGVDTITQRIQFAGLISTGDTTTSCIIQGIQPEFEPMVTYKDTLSAKTDLTSLGGTVIEQGRPLEAHSDYEVILGKGLAAGIQAEVGDNLIILGHTVDGIMNALDVGVAGVFYTSAKVFDDHTLRIPLKTAQELLYTDGVQSLVVLLKRTEQTQAVKTRLVEIIERNDLPLEVKTWDELNDFYTKTKALFVRMFFVLKLVIAIIVILSIYNTMNMAVIERTREIGTLMAMGTKRKGILQLFLWEGALLGAIGGLAGLAVGVVFMRLVQWVGIPMPPPPGATFAWVSQPVLVPSVMLFALTLSVVTALISSWIPARNAAELEPAEALRHA